MQNRASRRLFGILAPRATPPSSAFDCKSFMQIKALFPVCLRRLVLQEPFCQKTPEKLPVPVPVCHGTRACGRGSSTELLLRRRRWEPAVRGGRWQEMKVVCLPQVVSPAPSRLPPREDGSCLGENLPPPQHPSRGAGNVASAEGSGARECCERAQRRGDSCPAADKQEKATASRDDNARVSGMTRPSCQLADGVSTPNAVPGRAAATTC